MLQVQGAEQPVRLASLQVDVEVAGGAAETRVQMVFFNPNSRILEGKLQFPLAPGQVVSGFALDVDGRLRAAVPVEKARAQQVFEDIARRRVDPGLLQTTIGNNYELRVYPLLPGKTRTVELRIVEPAAAGCRCRSATPIASHFGRTLRVPGAATAPELVGASALGLRFERERAAASSPARRTTGAAQGADRAAPAAARPGATIATEERDGQSYFTLELPVAQRSAPRRLPHRVQIVWDASGSGAHRQLDRELALLDAYFAAVRDTSVNLVRVADVAAAPIRFEVRGGDWARSCARSRRRSTTARATSARCATTASRPKRSGSATAWPTTARRGGSPSRCRCSRSAAPRAATRRHCRRSPTRAAAAASTSPARRARAPPTRCCAAAPMVAGVGALGARELVVQSQSAAAGRLVVAGVLTAAEAEITVRLRDATGALTTRVVPVRAGRNPSRLAARAVGAPDAGIARGRSAHEQGPHPRDRQALRPGDARDLADRPRARRRLRPPRDRAAGRAARRV